MSEEEKYDELIRQKFAEKEFAFNEANWEKAEAMIDASRKTKKIFWWSAVFLIGLITGVFLMLPLIKNNSSPMNAERTKLTNSQAIDSLSNEKKEAGTEVTDHLKTAADELGLESNKNQSTKKPNSNASSDRLSANKFSTVSSEEPDSKNAQSSKTNTTRSSKKNKNTSKTGQDLLQDSDANRQLLMQQKDKKENKIPGTEKDIHPLADEKTVMKNTKPHVTKKSGDVNMSLKTKEITQENKGEETKAELAKKDALSIDIADSALLENKQSEEIAAEIDASNDSTKQEENKLAVADSVQKSDSVKVIAQDKTTIPPLDGLASATFLSIDAGINGQSGWRNKEMIEARGITPVFGLGITHAFNQTWSFSSGISYNGIGYLKGDSKTSKVITYDFGSTTTTIVTKPHFLHYITVPVMLQYSFNDKNAIMAGGSLSYLLNAKSKVEEHITYVRPIDTLSTQSSDRDYHTKTFNTFDAAVSVGYRRKISSRFSIIAIANFGLLDIKPDSFFLQHTTERNNCLKVILSYNIINF